MEIINGITAYPTQTLTVDSPNDDDSDEITITLHFQSRTQAWYCDISYGDDFSLNGLKLVNSPNILWKNHNEISFGLWVYVKDGFEPCLIDDFSEERCKLALLTSDEVDSIRTMILNGDTL